ncbi:MAG: hypothetical protein LCH41_10295 [Armatimonadetes bacterium]|nr:hypothetical protein [Armatimonadota bacterium]
MVTLQFDRRTFDLPMCVTSGQCFRWRELSPGHWFGVDGANLFEIELERDTEADRATLHQGDSQALRALFRLDEDFDQYQQEISTKDARMSDFLAPRTGLRLMRSSDPTEVLFSFLCSSNNHVARIAGMVNHLAQYGEVLACNHGQIAYGFPRIARLAEVSESDLRANGFGYRGATIPKVADELDTRGGEDYLESLKSQPYEEVIPQLISLPGVGPKLADCIALFGLGFDEAVPVDTHVWAAVTRTFFPEWQGKAITDQRYRTVGNTFRDLFGKRAGLAQQMLFHDRLTTPRNQR